MAGTHHQLYSGRHQSRIKVIPFNIQIMHKPESSDEKAVEIDA